ncbi:glycosyltransferase family 2 protein [Kyrpidia spormannii]|uniref:Glycosyltransferase 2-like domain-containing protein n=1 Tax=Kyrpidia spormannii TaxID=2055160 RepID=A0A6F9EFX7_9BACL|nr:glycosyltransferase family 2 protein [Kyrpidia spormannii]CAB3395200.1 conserved protein of unknown function [Kyrpidia spormannii]
MRGPMVPPHEEMRRALEEKDWIKVERLGFKALRADPADTKAWEILGEALLRQGYGTSARKAFRRAYLFHPQKQLARWNAPAEEGDPILDNGRSHPLVEQLLAWPRVPTVAAVIVAKNESRSIGRCLESLKGAVDEILVVDTGSTDDTAAVAETFPGVRVLFYAWNDNFAAARNFGLDNIAADWVLWIDADEWVHPDDKPLIREAAAMLDAVTPTPVLHPMIINRLGSTTSIAMNVPRLFPRRGDLRFHGRIHEQIAPVKGNRYTDLRTRDYLVTIRILHDGYDPANTDIRAKLQRNIRLLNQMVQEEPADPTWLMYLGREVLSAGDVKKGTSLLLAAEERAKTTPGFGALLEIQRLLVQAYLFQSAYDEAERVAERMQETDPQFPDSHYYLAHVRVEKAKQLLQAAEEDLRRLRAQGDNYAGLVNLDADIHAWKADLLQANICGLTGRIAEAKARYTDLYGQCPGYDEAIAHQIALIHQQARQILQPDNPPQNR